MGHIIKPYTFTSQTKILSAQVNTDFDTLYTQSNAHDDQIGALTAETATHFINVKYPPSPLVGAKGDGVTDDTTAIQNIINSISVSDCLFFPNGTYIHAGLTINHGIKMLGACIKGTILRTKGAGNNGITISRTVVDVSYWEISEMTIEGDGTNLGVGATTGSGIVLNNAWTGSIHRVNCRFHGQYGLKMLGGNYTINVTKCDFNNNLIDGVYGIATSAAQINGVHFVGNHIGSNGRSGLNLWGTSISVRENVIEGNARYGLEINADSDTVNAFPCTMLSVLDNYFEANTVQQMYFKGKASPAPTRIIQGLRIEGNYGFYNNNTTGYSDYSVLFDNNSSDHITDRGLRYVYWGKNEMTQSKATGYSVNFGQNLGPDSTILLLHPRDQNISTALRFINFGAATLIGYKKKYLSGYFSAKGGSGITYSARNTQSDTITVSGSLTYIPLIVKESEWLYEIGIAVTTDSTNYTLNLILYSTTENGTETSVANAALTNASGNQTLVLNTDTVLSASNVYYFKVLMTFVVGGTSLKVGSPYVITNA